MTLNERHGLPREVLALSAPALAAWLGAPSLIHLPGARAAPLFVALLLHGNETSGWQAVRSLLAAYGDAPLPRALSLFVGNTAAAAAGQRRLPGQPDWNRVWPGGPASPGAESELAHAVVQRMRALKPFAAVDLHNNNGANPHYACVNRLQPQILQLAHRFTRQVLYFVMPRGTLSAAFAAFCPAVTLECGKPDDPAGAAHAAEFLDRLLQLEALPRHAPPPGAIALYRSAARLTVAPATRITVGTLAGAGRAQLCLAPDLERLNWREQPAGTALAAVTEGAEVAAIDDEGADCGARYLRRSGRRLELARAVMPAMLTVDIRMIRQDCLCYLLEPLPVADICGPTGC